MNWTKVLPHDNLKPGDKKVVQAGSQSVLLIRQQDEIFAAETACPHMRLPLVIGRVDADCTLHCPWHHSAFDLRTGDVKEWAPWPPGIGPMLGKIRRERALQLWPTKVEDGHIWVSLEGDSEADGSESGPDDRPEEDKRTVRPVF